MNTQELAKRIFERADLYAWGRDKKHVNRKETVLAGGGRKLSIKLIEDALTNGRNLFITNKDGLGEIDITIDIDPTDQSCAELACLMMAKSLCETYPGAVHEPSTNGIGRHVHLRLNTEGWDAPKIQQRLRHFEHYLDCRRVLFNPGIKQVEVKQTVTSHLPTEKWGYLCRIPSVLPDDHGKAQIRISTIQEQKELPAKASGSGMIRRLTLPDWNYQKVQTSFKDSSYYLMAYKQNVTGGKKLLALDFQLALISLSIIALNPNEDKQLPTELVKAVWQKVTRKLGIERAFDYNRWASIRNTLSDCGWLNWTDNRYFFTENDDEVGIAMKWELLEQYRYCPTDQTTHTHTHIDNKLLQPIKEKTGFRPILDFRLRYSQYDLRSAEAELATILG